MYNQYDLYEWPGPEAPLSMGELILYWATGVTGAFVTFGRKMGKVAATQAFLNEQLKMQGVEIYTYQLDELARAFKPLTSLDTSPDTIKTLPKPKPSVGPRRGSAYDHRGRRRW